MLDPSSTNACPTTTRQRLTELQPRRALAAMALSSVAVLLFIACGGDAPDPEEALPADVTVAELTVTSDAFDEGGQIPQKYTCDGEDVSPDLKWNTPPADSRSIAVIADDPDAPGGTFIHWTVLDLPAEIRGLGERVGNAPSLPEGALHGQNGFGNDGYGGPCPPSGSTHEYRFWVYALSEPLALLSGAKSEDVITTLKGKVVAVGKLTGTYSRP